MKTLIIPILVWLSVMTAHAEESLWRSVDAENLMMFTTSKGVILIEIAPGFAKNHARQIRSIVRSGHYDGTLFHRVIENFMAQGGDVRALNRTGSGLPDMQAEFVFRRDPSSQPASFFGDPEKGANQGYVSGFPIHTQPEFLASITEDRKIDSWMRHCPGVASMARTNHPHSANSQFFLITHTSPWLDRKYTAWGRILDGLDVAKSLNKGQPPDKPDILLSAKMVADMPADKRPRIEVMRTDTKRFRQTLSEAVKSGQRDICALPPVKARIVLP